MIAALSAAAGRDVSRETFERLDRYVALLRAENARQNLVSAATMADVWQRHVLDSIQLVRFQPFEGASWVDIGAGAGLPGLVIAAVVEGPVHLVEPRRLRAEFLNKAVAELGLANVIVHPARAEKVRGSFDVITARAVAALPRLLELSAHLSTGKTRWVLPKGRSARTELAEAERAWQGVFHVEPSVTDDDSSIIVATGVRAK